MNKSFARIPETALAVAAIFLTGSLVLFTIALVLLVVLAPWIPLLFGMYYTFVGEYGWAVFALFCQIFILSFR